MKREWNLSGGRKVKFLGFCGRGGENFAIGSVRSENDETLCEILFGEDFQSCEKD